MTDTSEAQTQARTAVTDFKKSLLRDAAKEVFSTRGIREASVRQIAKTAGYTTSAIYTHYGSVEELYGDIVRESLELLLDDLRLISADSPGMTAASLRAFFAYYLTRPREFELSFHLYDGVRPHGLGDDLNSELNDLMRSVFRRIGDAFVTDGLATDDTAMSRATQACTFVFGLLLMFHTRRLFLLDEDPESLLEGYLALVQPS